MTGFAVTDECRRREPVPFGRGLASTKVVPLSGVYG